MSGSQPSPQTAPASTTNLQPSSQPKGVKREATNEDIETASDSRVKRQRNSSLQDLTLDDEPERDPTFWYTDGSVVLSVAETLFKLHRSRLASQSMYLQDLFDGAPEGDYEADGQTCPLYVVRVKGLKLFDFSSLLGLVENPFSNRRNEPEFAFVAAVARAAKLLGFDQALSWAVEQLEKTWSGKVADIERGSLEHAQEALELSRIVEVPTMRKRALYELMRMPSFGQTEESSTLTVFDYKVLTHAREKCTLHWANTMKKAPSKMALNCTQGKQGCSIRKDSDGTRDSKWWTLMNKEEMFEHHYLDPIGGYGQLKVLLLREAGSSPTQWCVTCCIEWKKEWTGSQESLWKDLDKWLELQ